MPKSQGATVNPETGEIIESDGTAIAVPMDAHGLDVVAMDQLAAALDLEEEAWKPSPGDKVTGKVIMRKTITGGEFGDYPMVQVLTPEGKIVDVHCFHTVLRGTVEQWEPAYGDLLAVKYLGRTTSGGFKDAGYENYRVIVSKISA